MEQFTWDDGKSKNDGNFMICCITQKQKIDVDIFYVQNMVVYFTYR